MAKTAKLGSLLLGEAVLGSIEEDVGFSATMAGEGFFTGDLKPFILFLAATMVGEGTLSGDLLTAILMAALMSGEGFLTGNLKITRFMGRLTVCGEPLTTHCQDWILGNRDPRRDG